MIELIWLVSFSIRDARDDATAAAVPMAEVLDDIAKVHEFAQIYSIQNATFGLSMNFID